MEGMGVILWTDKVIRGGFAVRPFSSLAAVLGFSSDSVEAGSLATLSLPVQFRFQAWRAEKVETFL